MKNRNVVERAWNHLRLALVWARRGGVLRRKLLMELRVVPKCLGHSTPSTQYPYYYEHQLSFDDTPIFRGKMHRPSFFRFLLPCMNPQVDFEDDHVTRCGPLNDEEYYYDYQDQEEVEIDKRAEEFIAKFYQQMKLQRQISLSKIQ